MPNDPLAIAQYFVRIAVSDSFGKSGNGFALVHWLGGIAFGGQFLAHRVIRLQDSGFEQKHVVLADYRLTQQTNLSGACFSACDCDRSTSCWSYRGNLLQVVIGLQMLLGEIADVIVK